VRGAHGRVLRSTEESGGIGEVPVPEMNALGGEEAELFGEGGAGLMAAEAAGGEVRGNDAVAGYGRGERVGAEGLADGAGGPAAYAATERGVGYDFARGDLPQGGVDFDGEGAGPVGVLALGHSHGFSSDLKYQIARRISFGRDLRGRRQGHDTWGRVRT